MRDSPSCRVSEQGPDWFLVAIEAYGGGTPDLVYFLEVSVFIGIFGIGNKSGRCPSHQRGRPARPPALVDDPRLFWPNSFTPGSSFGP